MRSSHIILGGLLALTLGSLATQECRGQPAKRMLTGIWKGTYTNSLGIKGDGYLDITEHEDGTLTGKWGTDKDNTHTIERGERVTGNVFHWEAASKENEKGRYRVRATLKGKTLELDVTYTWRADGKVKGITATSALARE